MQVAKALEPRTTKPPTLSVAPGRAGTAILLLLLLLALVVRVAWMHDRSLVIENEGGEYAAIANNLLDGKGYVGSGEVTGKPQLIFPPFYPIAIATLTFFTHDAESAGRFVSVVMGLVLVVALYKIAALMWGRRTGLIAAALAATHPLLVTLSTQVQTEVTYFALAFLGAYLGVKARRARDFVVPGVIFGLAYLTRPEGILLVGILGLLTILGALLKQTGMMRAFAGASISAGALLLVAAPYILFLHAQTGLLRLEYKTVINSGLNENIARGMDPAEAASGVDENLNEYGAYVGNVDRRIIELAGRTSPLDQLRSVSSAAVPQLMSLVGSARSSSFGGPLILLLGVVGFVIGPWTRGRLQMQAFLSLMLVAGIVSLFSVKYFQFRYAYFVLPFLLVYCAHALERLSVSIPRTMRALASRPAISFAGPLVASTGSIVTIAVSAGVVFISAMANFAAPYDDWGSSRAGAIHTKQAGLWLANQSPKDKVVMDAGSAIPYYSKADYIYLPYSSEDIALRYIDSKTPDFVVVRGVLRDSRPYIGEWDQYGIPGRADELVYDSGGSGAEDQRIQIYRWTERVAGAP